VVIQNENIERELISDTHLFFFLQLLFSNDKYVINSIITHYDPCMNLICYY